MMSIRLSTFSKQQLRLVRILQSHPCGSFLHLRFLSVDPRPQFHHSIINQAVQLLRIPHNEWNTTQINQLLFSDSPHSPYLFLHISRRLPSHSQALNFLRYIREHSPAPDIECLSFTLQAVIELASREFDSPADLYELYKASQELNVPLTSKSASILLRCLDRGDLVDESLVLFNELEGSVKNTHIRNILIRSLMKAGRVEDAMKVLDEMLQPNFDFHPNDDTGDAVFYWLLKRRKAGETVTDEKVVELGLSFGEFGVFPNSIWLTQMISVLCRNKKTNIASRLLLELIRLGAIVSAAPCNALLTGFGRDGNVDGMNKVMATMKQMNIQPNVITYGIIINQMCKLRVVDGALQVFQMMNEDRRDDGTLVVEPDVVIFNTLIDGLCKVGRQEEGLGLMERMKLQKGCAPNTVTYNCLIDGFCKVGEIERGLELFDEMKKEGIIPNEITLNTLIDGMCRNGRTNSAAQFLDEMQAKGFKCDAFAYTSLINAYCSVNNIGKAMECFHCIVKEGCSLDAMVYYNLINGLCSAGKMHDAFVVFLKLKEDGFVPDVLCYNVLINGFCNRKKIDEACNLLDDMTKTGVKPDGVTFNTLISYYGKEGDFRTARRLMRKMIKDGVEPTVFTYGAVIHAFCLHGKLDEAFQIFKGMDATGSKVAPNTEIYNMLIDFLCMNDNLELAISLMDSMEVKKVKPNATTFNPIFKVLRKRKWLVLAFLLMDKMKEQACTPDYITLEILTEWLPDVGETERLKNFLQEFGCLKHCCKLGVVTS